MAALTIPGLISKYKAIRLRSQFLKTYSVLQQVCRRMQADEISLDPSSYTYVGGKVDKMFYQIYGDYLPGAVDCGSYGNNQGSWKAGAPCYNFNNQNLGYMSLTGKRKVSKHYFDDGQLALQDGTLLLFENSETNMNGIWISADINGFNSPPNRLGYDLFMFELVEGELVTMGDLNTRFAKNLNDYCNFKAVNYLDINGATCAKKAKENSDYFKELVMKVK